MADERRAGGGWLGRLLGRGVDADDRLTALAARADALLERCAALEASRARDAAEIDGLRAELHRQAETVASARADAEAQGKALEALAVRVAGLARQAEYDAANLQKVATGLFEQIERVRRGEALPPAGE